MNHPMTREVCRIVDTIHEYLEIQKRRQNNNRKSANNIRPCMSDLYVVILNTIHLYEDLRCRLLAQGSNSLVVTILDQKSSGCEEAHLMKNINVREVPFSN